MPFLTRSFWLLSGALAYVAFAAISHHHGASSWIVLVGAELGMLVLWRWTSPHERLGERLTDSERRAIRAVGWSIALYCIARSGASGSPGLETARSIAVGAAAVAGTALLARVRSAGGLAEPPPASRSLDATAFVGLLWGLAVGVAATRVLIPPPGVELDPIAVDYATTAASLGTLMVLVAASLRLRILRKLDLGAAERSRGALALSITALSVALPATLLDIGPPDQLLEIAVLVTAAVIIWVVTIKEPTLVSRALRATIATLGLGAPIALFSALVARRAPLDAGWTIVIGCAACIVVGLIAERLARPLGPDEGRLLAAIDRAREAALEPEPETAILAALRALSARSKNSASRPQIWRLAPAEVLSSDVAGYLHAHPAEAPEELCRVALGEPERTLRSEVLRSLEVRRTDLRPLLAWMDRHESMSATLILDEDGPTGFILLPLGDRKESMTLEEARAIRMLADRLSALFSVSGALARSRARELLAEERARTLDEERARLERIVVHGHERQALLLERWARPIRASAFSPAARLAIDALERVGREGHPAILSVPPGVEILGWAALGHLSGPRAGGPLVVIEGFQASEHSLQHWEDPAESPLSLADGGTLLITHASALPREVQELIARTLTKESAEAKGITPPAVPPAVAWLAEMRAPGFDRGRQYHPALARYAGSVVVEIPGLDERSEDLRSLAMNELVALGLALRGEPLGLAPAAHRFLAEHEWVGNDVELRSLLTLAAEKSNGNIVTEADLLSAGQLLGAEPPELSPSPLPVGIRRQILGWRSPRGR